MKRISKCFSVNGYTYYLVVIADALAIYRQENKEKVVIGYEVHKVRVRRERITKFHNSTVVFPEKEILASNEEFGTYAWSVGTLERAKKKFKELQKENREDNKKILEVSCNGKME